MKTYKSFILRGMLCCSIAMMTGCATSNLVDVWSDASFQPPSLKKVLVISTGKNPAKRRIWEDAFSGELEKHNVAVTPSYRLFPDLLPDTNQIFQTLQSQGFDGVLITRWLPSETTVQYSQGYGPNERGMRYDRRSERFVTYYGGIQYAGYVDSQKVDIRAIDVWTTKNEGRLIWSATSETPEPNLVQEARPDIVKLVMSELTKNGMIDAER
jgi:hypothetical protein